MAYKLTRSVCTCNCTHLTLNVKHFVHFYLEIFEKFGTQWYIPKYHPIQNLARFCRQVCQRLAQQHNIVIGSVINSHIYKWGRPHHKRGSGSPKGKDPPLTCLFYYLQTQQAIHIGARGERTRCLQLLVSMFCQV